MNFKKALIKYGMTSQRSLARKAGVNEAVVNKLYHGTNSVNFVSLMKIAEALNVKVWKFIKEAEVKDDE